MSRVSFLQLAVRSNPHKDTKLSDIVYLDQNYRTFKYFLTGSFQNEEPIRQHSNEYSERSFPPTVDDNDQEDTVFLKKLTSLN